jgi:protein-L-isoaspartate(D-aspartate) O-methyltransferase
MTADFSEQRVKMVDSQLRTTDVTAPAILDAMLSVPREVFVGEKLRGIAYIDEDVIIAKAEGGNGPRYLMEPSPFAKLVQLAEIAPSDKVLDIGCGSGYSTAVLARLAASVVGLESDSALAAQAREALAALGSGNASVATGALPAGHAAGAPYDVIFIGGAVDAVPAALLAQLAEGGRLVVVEGHGNAGRAHLYRKLGGVAAGRAAFNAAIKPLPGFERAYTFKF